MFEVNGKTKVLFLGDSITYSGLYIAYLDKYILEHLPGLSLQLINAGICSETVSGLSEPDHPGLRPCVHRRLETVLDKIRPDVTFICYGMNDAIYYPFSEERFKAYKQGMIEVIRKVKASGSKVILMTPPPFDAFSFKKNRDTLKPDGCQSYSYLEPYEDYNQVLSTYAAWLHTQEYRVDGVVDVNLALSRYIVEQRKNNSGYISGDGIHPGETEHFVITGAILKKLLNITLEKIPSYVNTQNKLYGVTVARQHLLRDAFKELVETGTAVDVSILQKAEEMQKEMADLISVQEKIVEGEYKGYECVHFYVNGREGILVLPKNPVPEKGWIWRTEFLGAFDQADMAMVANGWYLAYYRISDMYGSPKAVRLMRDFQEYMEVQFGLFSKAVLFGFSRGGLYAFNYTAQYPDKVRLLYLDAPVLDIKSWPGGMGAAERYTREWKECLQAYNITEETGKVYRDVPVYKADAIAKAGIPVIIVAGGADEAVPYAENSEIMIERLKALGGNVRLILKPEVGHHPHSLEDPAPIVEFIMDNTAE